MPVPKRKTPAQLQKACDAWNAKHPVGTLVSYESIKGEGETHRGASRTEAQVLSGHSAVIWLEGKSGCVMLDHCTAVDGGSEMKRNAPTMTEQEIRAWLDEHTLYSVMDRPTPDNLLYFARTRGGANLVDIQERRYRLTHDGARYALQCLD